MACKFGEICGLESTHSGPGGVYCILHLPDFNKSAAEFGLAFESYCKKGGSDFSHFFFPNAHRDTLVGRIFDHELTLKNTHFLSNVVNLKGVVLNKGCAITFHDVAEISMEGAVVSGALSLRSSHKILSINLNKATLNNTVDIQADHIDTITATGKDTRFMDRTTIACGHLGSLNATESHLGCTQLTIKTSSSLDFRSVHFNGSCSITADTHSSINLQSAHITAPLSIEAMEVSVIDFTNASLVDNFKFRGLVNKIELRQVSFSTSSVIDIENAVVTDNFTLKGGESSPHSLIINNAQFFADVVIEGAYAQPPIQIIANAQRPLLSPGRTLIFRNVDLGNCRLVGNDIQKLEFDNVRWKKKWGRNVLYDEFVHNRDNAPLLGNLKEAYQILKERYKQRGDHVTSGDFHYGEMETRRRGRGPFRRWLWCPEVFYWAFSGYGIGYVRAFFILIGLITGFAAIYKCYGGIAWHNDFPESLLFSLRVSMLQKPELPVGHSQVARWVYLVESMLVPIQAALFVLALRMKMKR